MTGTPGRQPADVVVRTLNSAGTLGELLDALSRQTWPVRTVIVDSGSSDATLTIARRHGSTIVELPRSEFSYGRALNAGIAAATGDVVFALSSHALPPAPDWIERSLRHHEDPHVVAVCGAATDPQGEPLTCVVRQDLALAREHPLWGLTNTAASWRGDAVRAKPFDEHLEACEDKEWALRVLSAGGVVVLDPLLAVDSSHRVRQGLRPYFQRNRRERRALLQIHALPPRTPGAIARSWWEESRAAAPPRRGVTSVTRLLDHAAEVAAQRDIARASTRSRQAGGRP